VDLLIVSTDRRELERGCADVVLARTYQAFQDGQTMDTHIEVGICEAASTSRRCSSRAAHSLTIVVQGGGPR
jgi:hypothetical protein